MPWSGGRCQETPRSCHISLRGNQNASDTEAVATMVFMPLQNSQPVLCKAGVQQAYDLVQRHHTEGQVRYCEGRRDGAAKEQLALLADAVISFLKGGSSQ
jgi:hypothetical protein